jgi:hypothetical protein
MAFESCTAHIELNPVRAGIVRLSVDHHWSNIHAHLTGRDPNQIVKPNRLLELAGYWKDYL